MENININGEKTLKLNAPEVALILDALAGQPYARVCVLIEKIVNQVKDRPPEDAPS